MLLASCNLPFLSVAATTLDTNNNINYLTYMCSSFLLFSSDPDLGDLGTQLSTQTQSSLSTEMSNSVIKVNILQ